MNRFNVLLKAAVDKAGGKLAQRHIDPEVMLAVFFDHGIFQAQTPLL